jgi:hypothetical protein
VVRATPFIGIEFVSLLISGVANDGSRLPFFTDLEADECVGVKALLEADDNNDCERRLLIERGRGVMALTMLPFLERRGKPKI